LPPPPPPPPWCSFDVVVVLDVVDVVVVDGVVEPWEPQATDSEPINAAAAIPTIAEYRRELCFTKVITTQSGWETGVPAVPECLGCPGDSCQLRGGTPLTPSVEWA
jgi:hypothetical protein